MYTSLHVWINLHIPLLLHFSCRTQILTKNTNVGGLDKNVKIKNTFKNIFYSNIVPVKIHLGAQTSTKPSAFSFTKHWYTKFFGSGSQFCMFARASHRFLWTAICHSLSFLGQCVTFCTVGKDSSHGFASMQII